MKIEIKHRHSGKMLFTSDDAPSLKDAITEAIEKKFAARR